MPYSEYRAQFKSVLHGIHVISYAIFATISTSLALIFMFTDKYTLGLLQKKTLAL
jgi:hypothetical protein